MLLNLSLKVVFDRRLFVSHSHTIYWFATRSSRARTVPLTLNDKSSFILFLDVSLCKFL